MFSRAAKSLIKTISQRKYHAGDENVKLAMIGGAGEIGRSLSQMLKQTSKLDVLALYDVTALNKRFFTPTRLQNFSDREAINTGNAQMLQIFEKSQTNNANQLAEVLQESTFTKPASNVAQNNKINQAVETLRRLPIAEECTARPNTEAQGDNAYANKLQGPRVLAEMGPATSRHGGRIVSEIYKQFPDFAAYLVRNRFNILNAASARRYYSNVALLSNERAANRANDSRTIVDAVKVSSRNRIVAATKALSAVERIEKKFHSKKRDTKKTNSATISEQLSEKERFMKEIESRSKAIQKCDKKRVRVRRVGESKVAEEMMARTDRRSSGTGKAKNWTIPAVLSDKKPKMLYGLVHQRRKPLSNFFSRFFDIRSTESIALSRCNKMASWKCGKLACIRNLKIIDELDSAEKCCRRNRHGDRLNASTSTSDLTLPPQIGSLDRSDDEKYADRADENYRAIEDTVQMSSNEESENDAVSETNEPLTTLRKMSSRIALFLENLQLKRKRSSSPSSFTSYNLDILFNEEEAAPVTDCGAAFEPLLFASSKGGSKFSLKDRLWKKSCKKKGNVDDDICKKRKSQCKGKGDGGKRREAKGACQKKKEVQSCKRQDATERKKCKSSCDSLGGDPCESLRNENHGTTCKSYQVDPEYGKKEDPCKKNTGEKCTGKGGEDPCRKMRTPDHHGKPCKDYRDEFGKHDPCDKFWKDEVHGVRCKKPKKPDPCAKKKSDPCTTKKSDSCGQKKSDPCASKKSDPCTPKKPDPYTSRKEKCGDAKRKDKSVASKRGEKKDKCPPVVRAPGCSSKDDGKSGGSSGRKYSTLASRIRTSSSFDCRNVSAVDVSVGARAESQFNQHARRGNIYPSIYDVSDLSYDDIYRRN